jgi:hypothetical protein
MPPTIQLKRGTAAALLSLNPLPLIGEIIFEQDTGLFKIGDGIRSWVSLPYANPQSTLTVSIANIVGLQDALNNKADIGHIHSISSVTGLQAALDLKAPIASPTFTGTVSGITKSMVGLGNVDNTSDTNKPVSAAQSAADAAVQNLAASDATTKANAAQAFAVQRANHTGTQAISTVDGLQTALDGKAATTHSHAISDVTGLQTVLDGKQASGTYATLVSGTVPASQLPSYVDDVIETANLAALPATGEIGKIYVTLDSNKTYRWSGSAYVEISASPGSTDAVPEGSTNLYFTNTRASAAAPVQSVAGRTGAVTLTKSDVGLGNVDNTSDASKPISTATQTALDGKAASLHVHGNIDPFGGVSTVIAPASVGGPVVFSSASGGLVGRGAFGTQAGNVCQGNDPRLADSREWTAATVSQADAEAGTSTSRFAFTPQRIFQAVAAWWSSSAAKTKLDGIATGATANSSDATLLSRANHTGTQAVSTISGLQTALDGKANSSHTHPISDVTNLQTALDSKLPTADINTDLLAGAGLGFSYNSSANALTVYSTNEHYITALGAISGSVTLNYDPTSRAIQTMTLGGTATTFTKGTGWPTAANVSVDVVLKITVTTATTITWSIVNEWYTQAAAGALSVGTHLFLLRAIGSTVEGHYIASRTN